jgi:uncharacterized membrane protein
MSSGILLAFVISGFPIDKITIILSALGVGIGLVCNQLPIIY